MCFLANSNAPESELLLITRATFEDIFLDFWEFMMEFRLEPFPEAKTQRFNLRNKCHFVPSTREEFLLIIFEISQN